MIFDWRCFLIELATYSARSEGADSPEISEVQFCSLTYLCKLFAGTVRYFFATALCPVLNSALHDLSIYLKFLVFADDWLHLSQFKFYLKSRQFDSRHPGDLLTCLRIHEPGFCALGKITFQWPLRYLNNAHLLKYELNECHSLTLKLYFTFSYYLNRVPSTEELYLSIKSYFSLGSLLYLSIISRYLHQHYIIYDL